MGAIDGETEQGLATLPALFSACAGVHGEEPELGVVLDLEDMAMAADEKINDIGHL